MTFTTVGYGDKYPRTDYGRIICAITMFCGIFFLAMPLTIVGSSFSEAWDKLQNRKLKMTSEERLASKEWEPDYELVEELREKTKAHILRAKALMESLRVDAVNQNAGKEVGDAWERVLNKLSGADENFDGVLTLYEAEEENK